MLHFRFDGALRDFLEALFLCWVAHAEIHQFFEEKRSTPNDRVVSGYSD